MSTTKYFRCFCCSCLHGFRGGYIAMFFATKFLVTGNKVKKICILGASGFIGSVLEARLKADGHFVVSVARSLPRYRKSVADEFNVLDLTNPAEFHAHFYRHDFDETYQLAGNVGGIGHIGTGDHDAEILTESAKINLHTLEVFRKTQGGKIFFASSQCVYPDRIEIDPFAQERLLVSGSQYNSAHRETDAHFDTFAFGQEKLFAEKLYDAYARNYGIDARIARIGNTFGPYSTWDGDRAKAPTAICRKVAAADYGQPVDLWGDGTAVRSFTYIDDVIDGILMLMESDYTQPLNIASSETVTIAELFETVCKAAGKILAPNWIPGPVGAQARGSDNTKCLEVLKWEPDTSLADGIAKTYPWVRDQVLTKAVA